MGVERRLSLAFAYQWDQKETQKNLSIWQDLERSYVQVECKVRYRWVCVPY